MQNYPLRVRLYGGRVTHAARELPTRSAPACDYWIRLNGRDHWLDDDEPVTCRSCQRAINTAGGAS